MRRWVPVVLLVGITGVVVYFFLPGSSRAPVHGQDAVPPSQADETHSPAPVVAPPVVAPAVPSGGSAVATAPVTATPVASQAEARGAPEPAPSDIPPTASLASLRTTVHEYGQMFGGNPVGTNPEITRALNGGNPRHVNFLKEDGNHVNANGELVDPWGTPYFFHQLSRTEMEIHSAGPDRVMWTADDLVTK
jgi:hypothetical protein